MGDSKGCSDCIRPCAERANTPSLPGKNYDDGPATDEWRTVAARVETGVVRRSGTRGGDNNERDLTEAQEGPCVVSPFQGDKSPAFSREV